jgi:ADP-dependent NAD(P)H-hydrate dehydratase / NAD(P)H-hydrate epimerase
LVLGPGIGVSLDTEIFVNGILSAVNLPLVLDADGINNLKGDIGRLKGSKADIVITPHTGELSRLINMPVEQIKQNREKAAQDAARENAINIVLKGHETVVTDGQKTFLNPTGNPGMATGGSGDVLSGMIAAFIGQMALPRLFNAAICGVYIHGLAGDMAADSKTQISMVAGDIAQYIPEALKEVLK